MKKAAFLSILAAIALLVPGRAGAVPNPLVYPAVGGLITTTDVASPVAMDKVIVDITLKVDEAHVKAVYTMRNTKDGPVTASISLPEKDNSHKNQPAISNIGFKAGEDELEFKSRMLDGEDSMRYTRLHTARVDFKAGQSISLTVEFDCPTFIVMRDSGDKYGNRSFNLTMAHAECWSGNIKDAEVKMTLADDAARQLRLLQPAYATWEKDTVEWKFKDIAVGDKYDIHAVYGPEVYKNMKLEPGKDSVISVLEDPKHPEHSSIQWMAYSIGTKDIIEILHSMGKYKSGPEKVPGLQQGVLNSGVSG